jgi:hypothetical protein
VVLVLFQTNLSGLISGEYGGTTNKPFGEPAVDRREQITGLFPPALVAPEPSYAHRRAQSQQITAIS